MKISLQTWNAILLGPSVLALTYLSQTPLKADPVGRVVAFGLILYLALPVLILLIVDSIKIYHYVQRRK